MGKGVWSELPVPKSKILKPLRQTIPIRENGG